MSSYFSKFILLRMGSSRDILRLSPKMYNALKQGNVKEVEDLLKQGMDPDTTFSVMGGKKPALCVAAEEGCAMIIQLLCSHHCSTAQLDKDGLSPLHIAAAKGFVEAVRVLIKNRAEVNRAAATSIQETPLLLACNNNNTGIISVLIRAGAEVNRRNSNGTTPLMSAADQGNVEAVRMLVEAGADVQARDREGCTPLHRNAFSLRPRLEIVQMLCPSSEVSNLVNVQGYNSLMSIVSNDMPEFLKVDIVDYLIKMNCKLNTVSIVGATALHQACFRKNWNIVEKLIKAGARTNIPCVLGRTTLCAVLERGQFSLAEMMLAAGNPSQLSEGEKSKLGEEARKFLQVVNCTVKSLKFSCRSSIRRGIGEQGLHQKIDTIGLPLIINEYVKNLNPLGS